MEILLLLLFIAAAAAAAAASNDTQSPPVTYDDNPLDETTPEFYAYLDDAEDIFD